MKGNAALPGRFDNNLPCFPQERYFISEGLDLLSARVLNAQHLDGHGTMPVPPIHGPEGAHPDVLLVHQDF